MEDHYQNQTSKSKFEKILTNFVCVRSLIQIKIFTSVLISKFKLYEFFEEHGIGGGSGGGGQ